MKTPKEKYMNDPEYKYLVDMLENFIHRAQFTPSELREACVLASVNYEMKAMRCDHADQGLDEALNILGEYTNKAGSL